MLLPLPAAAQDWEVLGDCPDKRDWCLAMRQHEDCVTSAQELVADLLGGAEAATVNGVVLAEVADAVNPYDLHIEGHRSASVACMGTLQTFAARKEIFGPYLGVDVQ